MNAPTAHRLTVDEYYALPAEGDRRTQLIGGEVVVSHPRPIHAVLQMRIAAALQSWADAGDGRGLAMLTTDVVLTEYDAYGPDVVWVAEQHIPGDLEKPLARVPDLCVEVRSPSTWRYEVGRKKSVYEAGGLPELWLVDYDAVLVFRRSGPAEPSFDVALELNHEHRLASPQLPGFGLDLARLFRP
jgi:Uma2 family endonuclease